MADHWNLLEKRKYWRLMVLLHIVELSREKTRRQNQNYFLFQQLNTNTHRNTQTHTQSATINYYVNQILSYFFPYDQFEQMMTTLCELRWIKFNQNLNVVKTEMPKLNPIIQNHTNKTKHTHTQTITPQPELQYSRIFMRYLVETNIIRYPLHAHNQSINQSNTQTHQMKNHWIFNPTTIYDPKWSNANKTNQKQNKKHKNKNTKNQIQLNTHCALRWMPNKIEWMFRIMQMFRIIHKMHHAKTITCFQEWILIRYPAFLTRLEYKL